MPAPVAEVTAASQIALPLMDYLETPRERELILRAIRHQQALCAMRFGVTLPPRAPDPASLRIGIDVSHRYGIIDLSEAEQVGYAGVVDTVADEPRGGLAGEVLSGKDAKGAPSELRDADGNGLPDGGCAEMGRNAVLGDVSTSWDKTATTLLGNALQQLKGSTEFQQAERDWAACMAKTGHEFRSRSDAPASVAEAAGSDAVVVAGLDVKCALEVNYVGRAMAVEVAIQQQLIRENEGHLRGALDQKEKLVEQATAALN